MPPPNVVLYRYDASLFSWKIENILTLKEINYSKVDVPLILPRPEITDLLGLTYRRIPILAIGNDIYCDTSLISSALERRFPPSDGYGTIFPLKRNGGLPDTGLIKAFTKHYADTTLFNSTVVLLPWKEMPSSFLDDRRTVWPYDLDELESSVGKAASTMASHMALLNEQLQDGRNWLFDTHTPSLADCGIHFVYEWLRTSTAACNVPGLFDEKSVPHAMDWIHRFNKYVEKARADFHEPEAISGEDAAKLVAASDHEPYDVVGFDPVEAKRLELKKGQMVSMVPDDTGPQFATTGKLVALNKEEFTIETQGTSGTFRCHFPRIGFTAKEDEQ